MKIKIDEIQIGTRRKVNALKIKELAKSIDEVGLLNPIQVYVEGDKPGKNNPYRLVAGAHRLEACKSLDWEMIDASVVVENNAELAEIDENLIREELTEIERARLLKRRREIWVSRHSEKKPPGPQGGRPADPASAVQFDRATAEATGQSVSTVARTRTRGEKIAEDVQEAVAEMPAGDNTYELDALASLQPDEQRQALARVQSGTSESFRDARDFIRGASAEEEKKAKALKTLMKAWADADDDTRETFQAHIRGWARQQKAS